MSPVRHFPRNTAGRDFVVSDIHGQFDLLERQLDAVGFRSDSDRLFAVGDLIDRGRDSAAALAWLGVPWFHTIRGNHEQMALESESDAGAHRLWMMNGGTWWDRTDTTLQRRLLAAFAELPFIIEVETAEGLVGLVHADVPFDMPWPRFVEAVAAGDEAAITTALWSRARYFSGDTEPIPGVTRIYCGHTVVAAPERRGNVYFIDTGAYKSEQITLLPLATGW